VAPAGSARVGKRGDGEKCDLRGLTFDPEAHPLPDAQQAQPTGVKGCPVVRQLESVVEQHRACPGRGVEGTHCRLHAGESIGTRSAGS
jgi:hypothetical protein